MENLGRKLRTNPDFAAKYYTDVLGIDPLLEETQEILEMSSGEDSKADQ